MSIVWGNSKQVTTRALSRDLLHVFGGPGLAVYTCNIICALGELGQVVAATLKVRQGPGMAENWSRVPELVWLN